MVTQTHRYTAWGRKAKELASSGRFGALISIRALRSHDYFGAGRTGWHLDPFMSGGGVTFNLFIHMVDFVRYLAGSEVGRAQGWIGRHRPGCPVESSVRCCAEFENGVTAFMECDGIGHAPNMSVRAEFEKAVLGIRPRDKRMVVLSMGQPVETYDFGENGGVNEHGIYAHYGYVAQLTEMRSAIEEGGALTSDGRNGRANVAIARTILESHGSPLPGPALSKA